MAFCPSCGKVLPPNGVCECGYTAAAPAPQNNGQAGAPGAAGSAGSGAFGEAVNVFVGVVCVREVVAYITQRCGAQ